MLIVSLLIASVRIYQISGHGRLMEPPSRNAMWRFGFLNPINYNDNELFCGGVDRQFEKNDGKCGICGDAFDDPSPQTHQTGGEFGNRIISKTYVMGSVIEIEVEITANHKGAFQLKLCPLRGRNQEATQECFDRYPLTQMDGSTQFPIYETPHVVTLTRIARLPRGVTCNRCVLQWTWRSANSWNFCGNGTGALGCGPQETFRNCADVRIVKSPSQLPVTDNPRAIYVKDDNSKTGTSPLVVRSQVCVATGPWTQYTGMSDWCQLNCLRYPPHCPADMCTCLTTCRANTRDLDDFTCNKRCLRYPHSEECPRQCSCTSEPEQNNQLDDAVIIDARNKVTKTIPFQNTKTNTNPQPTLYKILAPLSPINWQYLPHIYNNFVY